MKAGLKYCLKKPDGSYSNLVDDPQEIVDACAERGITGEILAGWYSPTLFARIKPVIEYAEPDTEREPEPDPPKPEIPGENGTVRKKVRRKARAAEADQERGTA